MTARDAFEAIASDCLQQISASECCARDLSDIERVHQFRIGLRRLRSLVGSFRRLIASDLKSYLTAELDWIQAQTGSARDWDVLIVRSLQPLRLYLPNETAITAMIGAAETLRGEAYVEIRGALDSSRYRAFMLRVRDISDGGDFALPSDGESIDSPVSDIASKLLRRRYRKLTRLRAAAGQVNEREMHDLRISVKKLRYVAEFFRDLYPRKSTEKFINALISVQDCLGAVNDSVVGQRLADVLESRIAGSSDVHADAASHAKGLVRGWHAACAAQAMEEFGPAWRTLQRRRPYWKG
jgi:CHAD domain-containing protein